MLSVHRLLFGMLTRHHTFLKLLAHHNCIVLLLLKLLGNLDTLAGLALVILLVLASAVKHL